jgi:DNA repair protein RadC
MNQIPLPLAAFEQTRLAYLPERDRPVHRVADAPAACNTLELLAALVGGSRQIETAECLLARFGTLRAIRKASASEIASVQGIGQRNAARLLSALELGKRLASEVDEEQPAIHGPADAAALIQHDMSILEHEELWVLVLNTRNRLVEIDKLYRGSVNSSQIRVGEVFRTAIRRNATDILVAHCHPSGDPVPSPDDVAVTRAIVQAGKMLEIEVQDHLIIGRGQQYVSLRERGLGGFDGNR